MALRITFPQSSAIAPSRLEELQLTWETDEQGQIAYELQYKLKKDQVWSTCGKVYDNFTRSCSFAQIYEVDLTFE